MLFHYQYTVPRTFWIHHYPIQQVINIFCNQSNYYAGQMIDSGQASKEAASSQPINRVVGFSAPSSDSDLDSPTVCTLQYNYFYYINSKCTAL